MPACKVCNGRWFVSAQALHQHIQNSSAHPYCEKCSKEFSDSHALTQHTLAKHPKASRKKRRSQAHSATFHTYYWTGGSNSGTSGLPPPSIASSGAGIANSLQSQRTMSIESDVSLVTAGDDSDPVASQDAVDSDGVVVGNESPKSAESASPLTNGRSPAAFDPEGVALDPLDHFATAISTHRPVASPDLRTQCEEPTCPGIACIEDAEEQAIVHMLKPPATPAAEGVDSDSESSAVTSPVTPRSPLQLRKVCTSMSVLTPTPTSSSPEVSPVARVGQCVGHPFLESQSVPPPCRAEPLMEPTLKTETTDLTEGILPGDTRATDMESSMHMPHVGLDHPSAHHSTNAAFDVFSSMSGIGEPSSSIYLPQGIDSHDEPWLPVRMVDHADLYAPVESGIASPPASIPPFPDAWASSAVPFDPAPVEKSWREYPSSSPRSTPPPTEPAQIDSSSFALRPTLSPSAESMRSYRALERESLLVPPSPQQVAIPQDLAPPRPNFQHDLSSNSSKSTRPWEYDISDDGEDAERREPRCSSPVGAATAGSPRGRMSSEGSRSCNVSSQAPSLHSSHKLRGRNETSPFRSQLGQEGRSASPLALLKAHHETDDALPRESDSSERGGHCVQLRSQSPISSASSASSPDKLARLNRRQPLISGPGGSLLPQSAAQRHPIMHWGAKTRSSRRSDVDSTSPERTSIHSIQQERDTAGRSRLFSALGGKLSPEHPRYDKFVSSMHYERALAEHRRGSSPTPHRRGGFREGSRIATSVSSRRSEDRLSERRSADGTRVGSERSFVRSGGCSPSSGRAATSSPLALSPESFRSASPSLPRLPEIIPFVSPQCSRTSSTQAVASPSGILNDPVPVSRAADTLSSIRTMQPHNPLIKYERPEFADNEPHSPWSPVGVRGPARTLGFLPRSVRVGAAGSALDNRPMGFQSLLGAQLRPPSPTLSSISGALVPARRGTGNEALARTSKVPPSTLFSRVTRGRRARALAEPSGAACAGVSPPPPPESPRLVPVTSASASSPANSFSLESPDSWNDVVRRGTRQDSPPDSTASRADPDGRSVRGENSSANRGARTFGGSSVDAGTAPLPLRVHCRQCGVDPCADPTATLCGHVFCHGCITETVMRRSQCPVCATPTLLYCLFRLSLEV